MADARLFVANETGIPAGLHTGIVDTGGLMAFRAVVHFHAIPGIVLDSGNIVPPDVPAVTADAVSLQRPQSC